MEKLTRFETPTKIVDSTVPVKARFQLRIESSICEILSLSHNILQSQGLLQPNLWDNVKVENTERTKPAGSNSVSKRDGERTTFWRSSVLTGVDFFKATFSDHVYSRHTHSEYTIGVTERGAQVFNCQGAARLAPPSSFSLINPEEPHDGRSATGHDYSYRMMYVDPDALLRLIDRNGMKMQSSSRFPVFLSPIAGPRRVVIQPAAA